MAQRLKRWAVKLYCHRTFGQTPVLASLSQMQPTDNTALQEVTAFFSPRLPTAYSIQAHLHRRKEKKNLLQKKQETRHDVTAREKFTFLFM